MNTQTDKWVPWPPEPIIWGECSPWNEALAGLEIPTFLIISQEERAKAWNEWKGFGGVPYQTPAEQERDRRAAWREIEKEKARVRIEKLKAGQTKKAAIATDQAAMRAGKTWDARRGKWR